MGNSIQEYAGYVAERSRTVGALICNSALVLFTGIGLIMEVVKYHSNTFILYESLSGALALVSAALLVGYCARALRNASRSIPPFVRALRYITTCLLVINFATIVMFVGPQEGYIKALFAGPALFLNFLSPVLAFSSLAIFEPNPALRFRDSWWGVLINTIYGGVVFPLVYFGCLPNPYPVFDVSTHEVWLDILVGFLLLAVTFLLDWMVYLSGKGTALKTE